MHAGEKERDKRYVTELSDELLRWNDAIHAQPKITYMQTQKEQRKFL